jgi:hypothetical protein
VIAVKITKQELFHLRKSISIYLLYIKNTLWGNQKIEK